MCVIVLYAQLLRIVSTPGHPFIACYILLLYSTKSCLGLLALMILQNIRNYYLMMESYIPPDLKLQLDSLFLSLSGTVISKINMMNVWLWCKLDIIIKCACVSAVM